MLRPSGLLFKRLILVFWTMFFTMVAVTNFVDLMGEFGVFEWTFLNSGNFEYLSETVEVYDIGSDLTKVLLVGAFLIELVAAVLFWRALLGSGRGAEARTRAIAAVSFGVLVWTAFVFMTEFFVAYGSESPFRELLMIMIAAGLALVLVPDDFGNEA
jgi:hypothetical protein